MATILQIEANRRNELHRPPHRAGQGPHIHVRYSGQKALIAIGTLALLGGRLSPRAPGLVTEWAALHRVELMEDWSLAKAQAQLKPIAPLE